MKRVLTSILPFLCLAAALGAAEFTPAAKIQNVTVYPSEAQVERVAHLTLPRGEHRILIENLPPQLDEKRMTLSGRGEAKVSLRGVLIETQQLEQPFQEKARLLEDQIDSVQREIDAQSDTLNALSGEIDFLNSLKSAASAPTPSGDRAQDPREVMIKKILPQDYAGFLAYYKKTVVERQGEKRIGLSKLKKLQETRARLQRELSELGARTKNRKRAVVDLLSDADGTFDLVLNYMIGPAGWLPSYEARILPDAGEVLLTYGATVNQNTGEDWENVSLALSTLKPSLGAAPPAADPWYVGYEEEAPRPVPMMKAMRSVMAAQALREERAMDMGAGSPEAEAISLQEAMPETAGMEGSGSAVRFQIKSKESVPSGKSSRKLSPAILKLKADFEYEALPRLSPHAFLKSKVSNGRDYPLLPGGMEVYLENNYVGSSALKTVAPEEEFDLFGGADDGVKVSVENIKAGRKESTGSQDRSTTFSYRMKVENFKKAKARITLIDRTPISTDNRVRAGSPDFSPKPTESEPDKGLYKWQMTIDPKGKAEVEANYKVTYPKSGRVTGL